MTRLLHGPRRPVSSWAGPEAFARILWPPSAAALGEAYLREADGITLDVRDHRDLDSLGMLDVVASVGMFRPWRHA